MSKTFNKIFTFQQVRQTCQCVIKGLFTITFNLITNENFKTCIIHWNWKVTAFCFFTQRDMQTITTFFYFAAKRIYSTLIIINIKGKIFKIKELYTCTQPQSMIVKFTKILFQNTTYCDWCKLRYSSLK